jgi:DNA-nicking Smr family endonuclease
MTDKKPQKSRLRAKDVDLWRQMTADVEKSAGKDYVDAADLPEDERADVGKVRVRPGKRPSDMPAVPEARGQGIDRRTDDRLRRGKIRPEARIDLHGMGQDEAFGAFKRFIQDSYAQGRRCVLVITGKGRRSSDDGGDWTQEKPGVLRRKMPDWIQDTAISGMILQTYQAQPGDGGAGAVYVLLRRHRD